MVREGGQTPECEDVVWQRVRQDCVAQSEGTELKNWNKSNCWFSAKMSEMEFQQQKVESNIVVSMYPDGLGETLGAGI